MLSLKKTMDGLDREQERLQALLECYLAALHGLREHAVEVSPEITHEFQVQLRALHDELSGESGMAALEQSRTALLAALVDFKTRSTQSLIRKEEDLRGILDVLSVAAEAIGGHNDAHSVRLKEFTTQLQLVARGTDLACMRVELTRRVEQLKTAADTMWRENHTSVNGMQAQLVEFQKRLERAESQAATDALTGLMNRGEGESRLRNAIAAGRLVSVILIDLDGFKQVNDRWGHSAGDQVLKTFARALNQHGGPMGALCRWGGDEFLLMLNGNEEAARRQAAQLRGKLRIALKLVILGKIVTVAVEASLGVAQARAGEPMEDLLTRADVELYGHKDPSKLFSSALLSGGAA